MKKIIKLFGEVNQEMYNYVFEEVMNILSDNKHNQNNVKSDVVVLINSMSGNIYQGRAILDLLQLLPNKIKCVLIGSSWDATNVIFFSFNERYHTINSRFIFDDGFWIYKDIIKISDFNEAINCVLEHRPNAKRTRLWIDYIERYDLSKRITNYDLFKEFI